MKIDAKKLREVYVKYVPVIAKDERFYHIQNAKNYALTTYGRLFLKNKNNNYCNVGMVFIREDAYPIRFDDKNQEEIITIRKLLADVFFPKEKGIYLCNPRWNPFDKCRWRVEDLHILRNKDDIVEYINAKIEGRQPNYDKNCQGNTFINRVEFSRETRKSLHTIYWGMRSRATNAKSKKYCPQYKNTTISDEWLNNPESFYDWYFEHQYYYPGNISIDKDLLGFGKTNCYTSEYVAELPTYINNIFVESNSRLAYCIKEMQRKNGKKYYLIPGHAYILDGEREKSIFAETYVEALKAGRKRKADYIRKIVKKEREAGYLPEYILFAMEKWANLCELGLVHMWEPSDEILTEMGVM